MHPFAILAYATLAAQAAVVRLPGVGRYRANELADGSIEALAIPYAKPPLNDLRFAPPAPLDEVGADEEEERDATQFGKICMQLAFGYEASAAAKLATHMGEDCLTLNVWAPANASGLPVYFWIHGGAFIEGSGSWLNGSALAAKEVVVVTINYRLGLFGFLNLDQLLGGGNVSSGGANGLLDQVEALRWVHKHIHAFGGDPNQITIGGESAGSLSVCDHLHMPVSAGLFQRAIMESGSCVGYLGGMVMDRADARDMSSLFFQALRVKTLEDLRKRSGLRLLLTALPGEILSIFMPFPSVDGVVLTAVPNDLPIASPEADIISGTNTAEGDATVPTDLAGQTGLTSPEFYASYVSENLSPEVLTMYPAPPAGTPQKLVRRKYLQLLTDLEWTCPKQTLSSKLRAAGNSVRSYSFGFWPNKTGDGDMNDMVCHACEEIFTWRHWPIDDGYASPYIAEFTKEVYNDDLADTMTDYWTDFIKRGSARGHVEWTPQSTEFGAELVVRSDATGQPVIKMEAATRTICQFWANFLSDPVNLQKALNFSLPGGESASMRGVRRVSPEMLRQFQSQFVVV